MRLSLKEIEARVAPLGGRSSYDREFIFDLLLAYGRTQSNVTRLRSTTTTSLNVAVDPTTEVAQKSIVYFKEVPVTTEEDLLGTIETLSTSPAVVRFNTRFVIVTDYERLLAKDTKTNDTLSILISDIADHFTFFLPWSGMEKAQYTAEAHADVKAAERMAKLFDELLNENPGANETLQGRHSLNIFFTRLLFCFFAEDTGIFAEGQFTKAVVNLTRADGSDLHDLLGDLFTALDTEDSADKPKHLADFPYVNGRLFEVKSNQTVPVFNKKGRDYLVESGKLQWSQINPDIFGSMFQAIVTPGQRSDLGQHYTSVPNILKTIEPLFLDELKSELDASFDSEKKLEALLNRIAQIKVFDPACGSGNFLIIAYKELRKLEHATLERLTEISPKHQLLYAESHINIENFYGIEIDDFAVEVAILSLWIAKHQMNAEFKQKFRIDIPLIPLKEMGQIKHGNAARTDWQAVCPNDGTREVYLIGNPPYSGAKLQSKEQKTDFEYVFGTRSFNKNLDYIALWFLKGADYIRDTKAQLSFVTTNSVSQGEHVGLMFPILFDMGLEIGYAYTSFKWENNAKNNAGVTVAVINLRNRQELQKYLFVNGVRIEAKNINGYLADGNVTYLERRRIPLSGMPEMVFGSMPRDGGHLILSASDRDAMIRTDPRASQLVRRYIGSDELISGRERYCLWIDDSLLDLAKSIPDVVSRLEQVAASRRRSKAASTAAYAAAPHRFVQRSHLDAEAVLIPAVSSEQREYIPFGFKDRWAVANNRVYAAYGVEPWLFAILSSRMHMVWTRAVSGRLETRLSYSNTIVYNNFPVSPLSDVIKEKLTERALRILDVREYHSELTLADLYDPDLMPDNLRLAHRQLDELVDSIYRKREFESDEERLSMLFEMYASMTEAEAKK